MRNLQRLIEAAFVVVLVLGSSACGRPLSAEGASEPDASSSAVAHGIATAAHAAATRAEAPEECVGCSARLAVDGASGGTCRNNGPPSSHDLLLRWGKCLCQPSTCASSCGICGSGAEQITVACLDCGRAHCPAEYAACAADVAPVSAKGAEGE
jgi:hypothetical protein